MENAQLPQRRASVVAEGVQSIEFLNDGQGQHLVPRQRQLASDLQSAVAVRRFRGENLTLVWRPSCRTLYR